MSLLNVNKVDPATGTALEIGTSGDTITIPTGAGLTVTDEVKTNKISPASGTAFTLGDSGDTFTIPSGATITNSGTATGFGMDGTPAWYATDEGQVTISASTWTTRIYGSEVYDTNSAYNTSTGIFTVPSGENGRYLVFMSSAYDSSSSGRMLGGIYVGGTSNYTAASSNWAYSNPSTPLGTTTQVFAIVNAAVGDEIQGRVFQDAGSINTTNSNGEQNWFAGWKLS